MTGDNDKRHWHRDRPRPAELDYLGPIGIEVVDAAGTTRYTPNDIAMDYIVKRRHTGLRPIPGKTSIITGEPAVLYRTQEVEIALTPEELGRLVRRSLTPKEFFAICDAVSCPFELHSDFYDSETGEALQPADDYESAAFHPH